MPKDKREPFSRSLASWHPSDPKGTQGVKPETAMMNPREQALKLVRAEYQAAKDCYVERISDLRAARSIVIPTYHDRSAAVPFELYQKSQHPGAVTYVPLVASEADRDHYYYSVTQRRGDDYKQTQAEHALLYQGVGPQHNRKARMATLDAIRDKRITGQDSIMMNVRLDRKPQQSSQTIYLEYALHEQLRTAGLDIQLIDHLMTMYHNDLGYKAMAITRDYLPPDLEDFMNHLPKPWRLLDVSTFDPKKYREEAQIMQQFGVNAIDVLIYHADESLS